jgi:hypothetical protein
VSEQSQETNENRSATAEDKRPGQAAEADRAWCGWDAAGQFARPERHIQSKVLL